MVLEYMHMDVVDVQNGEEQHRLTYEVDAFKPKCWVEGFEYKFNSHLIKKEVITNERQSYQCYRVECCS